MNHKLILVPAALTLFLAPALRANPMQVQRLDGWGNYIQGMGYELQVTAGYLHPNCSFDPLPPSMQYQTLTGFGGDPSGFLQLGAYYLFGPWAELPIYTQLYPWATLIPGPSHGPGKTGHWRVVCGGGGGTQEPVYPAFGNGRSLWQSSGSNVRVAVPEILNRSGTRTTGDLLVWVLVHRNRNVVQLGGGYILATIRYGTLPPNYKFNARSVTTGFRRPPRGRYYSALVLAEWTGRHTARDSRVFGGTVRFR